METPLVNVALTVVLTGLVLGGASAVVGGWVEEEPLGWGSGVVVGGDSVGVACARCQLCVVVVGCGGEIFACVLCFW